MSSHHLHKTVPLLVALLWLSFVGFSFGTDVASVQARNGSAPGNGRLALAAGNELVATPTPTRRPRATPTPTPDEMPDAANAADAPEAQEVVGGPVNEGGNPFLRLAFFLVGVTTCGLLFVSLVFFFIWQLGFRQSEQQARAAFGAGRHDWE